MESKTLDQPESVFTANVKLYQLKNSILDKNAKAYLQRKAGYTDEDLFCEMLREELLTEALPLLQKFLHLSVNESPRKEVVDIIGKRLLVSLNFGITGTVTIFAVSAADFQKEIEGGSVIKAINTIEEELNGLLGEHVSIKNLERPDVPERHYFGLAFSENGFKPTFWDHWKHTM